MYSNCLFEALKAKIKDPKNVHIHKIPAFLNPDFKTPFPHFYWTKGDSAFAFNSFKPQRFQVFLFQGEIQDYSVQEMQDKIKRSFNIYTHRLCKKYGDIFENYRLRSMDLGDEKPVFNKYKPEWIIISFWKDKKVCTRLICIEDFDKYEDVITWRYAEETVAAHYRDETATLINEDGYSIQ